MLFYFHQRDCRILLLEGQGWSKVDSNSNLKHLLSDFCRWDAEQHTGVEVDWRDTVEQVGLG